MLNLRVLLFVLMPLLAAPVFAQAGGRADGRGGEPARRAEPDQDDPHRLFSNRVDYPPLEGPTRKRNVSDIETLFDGEHAKPYELAYLRKDPERRYTLKDRALLGSFSFEARAGGLFGMGDDDSGGFNGYARLRFGPAGLDLSYLTMSDSETLDSVIGFRAMLDLDIYHWLTVRPTLGVGLVTFEGEDDASTIAPGIEAEFFLAKPFTIEAHFQAYQSEQARYDTLREGYLGIGFLPTLLTSGKEYPVVLPELRAGLRRLVGGQGVNLSMLSIELAVEF